MALLKIDVDISEMRDLLKIDTVASGVLDKASRDLAALVHGRIQELAKQRLHSRLDTFMEGLSPPIQEDGVWIISLDKDARWTDDGVPAHNMLEDLLASSKAKTSRDGSKYLVVPFDKSPGKGKTKTTRAEQDLVKAIKSEMKKNNVPFKDIERDHRGRPLVGRLHSFDILNRPKKKFDGPGQGHGPVGGVRQGPTGIPFLQGVRVYQSWFSDIATKHEKVQRSIFTFRTASSKHRGDGNRWMHPGTAPANIFEDAWKTAFAEWERDILPDVIDKILASI